MIVVLPCLLYSLTLVLSTLVRGAEYASAMLQGDKSICAQWDG